ncbi:NAD(P)-binding domain-containing protein [Paracoccaceae bacterium]|nr:NAD(P)-binding domain-containing protein [Paracoccaceae bacterium]
MGSEGFNKNILKEKIGLAGCGNMGLPMLNSMVLKNIDVKGYDIESKKFLPVLGNNFEGCKRSFLADRNIIISVVRDEEDTLELCQGDDGLFEQQSNKIFIISSTLSPRFLVDLKRRAPKNLTVIDAPMSGATIAAKEASLTFMVGSEKKTICLYRTPVGINGQTNQSYWELWGRHDGKST